MTRRSNTGPDAPAKPLDTRQIAQSALRKGDFDFALRAVERGEADIPELVEDLKIYQAELEMQNEELRNAQLTSERAVRRFNTLFTSLPLPALVIDEFGVVSDCNELAEESFVIERKFLRSHFFPRLIVKQEQARLRRAIDQAKVSGQASLLEVGMQPVEAKAFVADIHLSLLPDSESSTPHFAVIVVDQTDRLERRIQLEKSHRHFMAYFNTSPVGMTATSLDKGWIEVNDRLCQMLGYERDELTRMTWLELTHPQDAAMDIVHFNRLLAGEADDYSLDKRFIRKDGSILDSHMAVRGVRDRTGKLEYFVAILEDIEDRKNAERELLTREEMLREQSIKLSERVRELGAIYAISRAAHDARTESDFFADVITHLSSGIRYAPDVCVRIAFAGNQYETPGYAELPHKFSVKVTIHGAEQGELSLAYDEPPGNGGNDLLELEDRLFMAGAADLIGHFIEGFRDRQARALSAKRNSALLQLTTRAAGLNDEELIRYALDQAESMTASNIAYAHVVNEDQESLTLGTWSSKTLKNCGASFEQHYPISKAGVWADCFRTRQPVIHNDYASLTTKRGLPEGHARLLRHMSVPVIEGQNVVMIFGVGNKATDYDAGDLALLEVLANNLWALLQRNRSLRELERDAEVFRMSREAVMIANADSLIVSVNDAFTQITGFSAEEAIGQTPKLLKSGKHDADFYQKMWQQIENDGHWQGEIWNRRKNGEIYPQWLGITVTRNSHGAISEYIAIFMDIGDHKRAQAHIEQLGYYDPLTGLGNRRLLNERTKQVIALAQRQQHLAGLIYLDLDHFKDVNDGLGHLVGDELLKYVATRLQDCVRQTDTVCRMGGDEFVVLLTKVNSPGNVADACSKILDALCEEFEFNQHTIRISCSIGASIFPMDGETFDDLLRHADTAMYQAKADGRNNFKLFTSEMNTLVQHRLKLQLEMRRALDQRNFFVEYQPQFDLASRRIIGVEALARWHHPTMGTIAPGEFIPIAEESNLIVEIGREVMRQACQQASRWLDAGHRLSIAVNVSYVQFARDNLLKLVSDVLQETQLPADLLELELTESILVTDFENILAVVDQLHARGVTLSIDDFGTGYSNLSYLKRLSVHKLKIDQSFIRDILIDPDDAVIVSAIINLARNLRMECIAEGVETEEQARKLGEMGCPQVQGYWLARPISAAAMDALLAKNAN